MSRRVLRGFRPDRLEAARLAAGMSRGDVARLADVSVGAVASWETGRATPQVDTLARVIGVLSIEAEDVIDVPADDRYLSDLRALRGVLQPNLAATLGVSTTTLASVERGEATLTDHLIGALAGALRFDAATVRAAYDRTRSRPANGPG